VKRNPRPATVMTTRARGKPRAANAAGIAVFSATAFTMSGRNLRYACQILKVLF